VPIIAQRKSQQNVAYEQKSRSLHKIELLFPAELKHGFIVLKLTPHLLLLNYHLFYLPINLECRKAQVVEIEQLLFNTSVAHHVEFGCVLGRKGESVGEGSCKTLLSEEKFVGDCRDEDCTFL